MVGTPIYDKMMADKAKKDAAKASALKPKKAPKAETGLGNKLVKNAKPGTTPKQKIKRGTK
jgi:hypothetical protein